VIYLDTSVVLAQLLAEDRLPPASLWRQPLVSSRLLEYEVWNRLQARGLGPSHSAEARSLIGRIALIEMAPPLLVRALEPFPASLRTLDALHLAALEFLRDRGQAIELATYDDRLLDAARSLGIPVAAL
jgi:predicted nucleic acid-binding protein